MFRLGKNILLLWQGQLISQLGTHAFNIARLYWLVETLGKGFYIGSLLTVCSLVLTFCSPFGGYFADHFRRKMIVIGSDIISGLSMLGLAGCIFFVDSIAINTVVLFITSALVSASTAFFGPAVQASIPNMVSIDKVPAVNAALSSSYQIGQVIGQGLGGILITVLGIPTMILINGLSFMVSAFTEIFIDFQQKSHRKPESSVYNNGKISPFSSMIKSIQSGLDVIRKNATSRSLVLFKAFDSFLLVPLFVITPYLSSQVYGGNADDYGYLIGLFSLGTIAGYGLASTLSQRLGRHLFLFRSLFFIRGFMLLLIGATDQLIFGFGAYALIGFAGALISVQIDSYFQISTNNEVLGRVFGLMNGLNNILVPISFAIAGFSLDVSGMQVTIQFVVYGVAAIFLAIWINTRGVLTREHWINFKKL